jgi:hypothetical protein
MLAGPEMTVRRRCALTVSLCLVARSLAASCYIEDAIYPLSSVGVQVNSLFKPEVELAKAPFDK